MGHAINNNNNNNNNKIHKYIHIYQVGKIIWYFLVLQFIAPNGVQGT